MKLPAAIDAIGSCQAIGGVCHSRLAKVKAGAPNTYRHRIEHNTWVRPELLKRYGRIGFGLPAPGPWQQYGGDYSGTGFT